MGAEGLKRSKTQGVTVWLTGLPSAGKSTIAVRLAEVLTAWGQSVELLDGDEIRERLSKGLGFSRQDRDENIRRISYVARLLTKHGVIAVVAAISPYRSTRDEARGEIGRFVEVHVNCELNECVRRDVKGLYKKALSGEIRQFTGISDPYEEPLTPEAVVNTHAETLDESVAKVIETLGLLGYLPIEVLKPAMHAAAASSMAAAAAGSGMAASSMAAPAGAAHAVGGGPATATGGSPSAASVGGAVASE